MKAEVMADLLAHSAAQHASSIALEDATQQWTYRQLARQVQTYCSLFESAELQAGQRVALFSTNNCEYMALYFACAALGLVAVPINAHLGSAEIDWIVGDASPVALIVESAFVARFELLPAAQAISHRWVIARPGEQFRQDFWQPLAAAATEHTANQTVARRVKNEDLALLMYTSGTTGNPKGVMFSHHNMLAIVAAWLQEMPLRAASDGSDSASRFMLATPLFHIGALLVALCTIAAGARLIMLAKFEPRLALHTLVNKAITHSLLVPAMIQRLLQEEAISNCRFPALDTLVYGASPMPEPVLLAAQQRFACNFVQGYGLTETSGVALVLRAADHHDPGRLRAAGRPVVCNEVRIVDAEGHDTATDQVGEVLIKGDNVCRAYWNNPAASSAAIEDGWLHSGDLGFRDSDGFITIVDRSKDMIDMSGENVYPVEVEHVLTAHPAIAEVAVIGLPKTISEATSQSMHPHEARRQLLLEQQVVAVVVLASAVQAGVDRGERRPQQVAQDIIAFSRAHLAKFKCPVRVLFCDALPRTPAGKIQKQQLREHYSAELAARSQPALNESAGKEN